MNQLKRTDVRPTQEEWTPVLPGVYKDAAGATHFSIPGLMDLCGMEDTPENRQSAIETAQPENQVTVAQTEQRLGFTQMQ